MTTSPITYKRILGQYVLAIVLSMLIIPVVEFSVFIFPDIGWHFLTVLYVTILLLQVSFYYLTSRLNLGLSVLSFVLNFILWVAENVNIDSIFADTYFYKECRYAVIMLGSILWATNKIFIDVVFSMSKKIVLKNSKIDKLMLQMFR